MRSLNRKERIKERRSKRESEREMHTRMCTNIQRNVCCFNPNYLPGSLAIFFLLSSPCSPHPVYKLDLNFHVLQLWRKYKRENWISVLSRNISSKITEIIVQPWASICLCTAPKPLFLGKESIIYLICPIQARSFLIVVFFNPCQP